MDAGAFGNRLGLEEAYRLARGEQVTSSNGTPARLSRLLEGSTADNTGARVYFTNLVHTENLIPGGQETG
jgi:hypothetical protein